MQHLKIYNKQDILSLTRIRRFETKLGERLHAVRDPANLQKSFDETPAQYVLLGIPEDIGVKANEHTMGGADTVWLPFLQSFLNIQSNYFLDGEEILLLGHFDFGDLQYLIEHNAHSSDEKTAAYRHAVLTIDAEVESLIKLISAAGKIPLVIGGGHNNAYPLIKGTAKGLHQSGKIPLAQINTINLDAHADLRPMEGRHSGNPFTYAEADGYLQKYCVVGVHESYLPQNVWLEMINNPFVDCITYEDIFIHEKRNFLQAVAHATGFTEDTYTGIELDLDCVEDVLCSAATPSGISVQQARQFMNFTATDCKVAYLHICEGASRLDNTNSDDLTGKLIGYLIADFVKAHLQSQRP